MDITLPKRIDVSQTPLKFANARIITVIGANGAGKTRFCRKIMEDVGDHAFRISALEALFPKKEVNTMSGSIDMLYSRIEARTQIVKGDVDTEIEKLAFLLFHDEFLSLLKYKMLTLEHQSAPMSTASPRLGTGCSPTIKSCAKAANCSSKTTKVPTRWER